MALLDDILTWSRADLKPWQQDALRRLFQKTVDVSAIDDLYAMLKSNAGIEDVQRREPEPLDENHLPVTPTKDNAARLISLGDIKDVNRLLPGQVLKFSLKGLTIIYGGNGTGKSGYARILKRACRSRDVSEDIHTNAQDATRKYAIPQATFNIELEGEVLSLTWQKNRPSPKELATIAVFDTYCARAYLDQQQEVAYLPIGLDMVEGLAQIVLPKILEKLNAEIATIDTSKEAFNNLIGVTKVGNLIASLSEKTKIEDIKELAQMESTEILRMKELEKALNESDPKTKIKDLRLVIGRVSGLKVKIEKATAWVTDEFMGKLQKVDNETELVIAGELAAANVFRSGETLLPGTGDVLWKILFQAARDFSLQVAYPDKEFPHTHTGSTCLLCQQILSPEAGDRLRRFESYIQENVSKVASEKRELRKAVLMKIENAPLAFDIEDVLREELAGLDPEVFAEINVFDAIIQDRRKWLLVAQGKHNWEGIPPFSVDPCIRLQVIIEKLTTQIGDFEKVTDDKQRLVLKNELGELIARSALDLQKQPLLNLIERMRVRSVLTKCREELKTKSISEKAKEFANKTVTGPLRKALTDEFDKLHVAHIVPRLNENVERGKMRHKLELDLQIQIQIRDILSEGEQRVIALGCFLAELQTGGHDGGIIFDDPVSSLDHFRRKHVAKRLVDEAKVRQVIIFTHDTSFLGELNDLIEETKVDHIIHHLEWYGDNSGKIADGLPWMHKSYKDKIDKMQQAQTKLVSTWPIYPNEEQSAFMRGRYSLLRATIERVIQDVVFNGVVARYRDWIKVGNLGAVVGFEDIEYREIERLHKICCDVVEAHDQPSEKNASVPSASQLGNDIAALVAITEAIKLRQNKQVT